MQSKSASDIDEDVFVVKHEPGDSNPTLDMTDSREKKNTPVTTPRKHTKKQVTDSDALGDDDGTPSKKGKTGTPSGKPSQLGPVSSSYEETSVEDKKIIYMRDVEGRSFSEIQGVIEAITGAKMGSSTLRSRYYRMKSNFVVFDEKDVPVLFQTKKGIEDKFELEKWQKLADGIESKTGNNYPAAAVQKKFKDASKSNGV